MFNINLTLFVQILHFGIAYVIIKRLLFSQSMEVIDQEERSKKQLAHSIDTKEYHIQEIEQQLDENWCACRAHCQAQVPEHPAHLTSVSKISFAPYREPHISSTEYENKKKHITSLLVQEVGRVRS